MYFRTTFFLLIAVLIVGSAFWFVSVQDRWDIQRDGIDRPLWTIYPDRVRELAFERDTLRIETRRIDGAWRMIAPVNTRADAGEIDRLLHMLHELRHGPVITMRDRQELGLSLGDFGLDRPWGRIEWGDEAVRRTLLIGDRTGAGDQVYVKLEGSHAVAPVASDLLEYWPASAIQLRDRVVFHGEPRRVFRIEIRRPDGFVQVQRMDEGGWRIQQPVQANADAAAIRQWLDGLFDWRIQEFMADAVADVTVYGLDATAVQITVWNEEKPDGQTVRLGVPVDAFGGAVYARRSGDESVFSLPEDVLVKARTRIDELRDRMLVPLKRDAIRQVRISDQDEQYVELRKAADRWMIHAPVEWPADQQRVADLLDTWTDQRIERFYDNSEPAEPPSALVEVTLSGMEPLPGYTYQLRPDTDDGQTVRVKRKGETTSFTVDRSILPVTVTDPLHFRHRRLFDFHESDVVALRQSDGDRFIHLKRQTDGSWAPMEGSATSWSRTQLAEALTALARLQADEFVAYRPTDWAAYGLDEPRMRWTLTLSAEAGLGRALLLGDVRPDGRAYARTLGQGVVFLINQAQVEVLLPSLEQPAQKPPASVEPREDTTRDLAPGR